MNARTTSGQSIPIQAIVGDANWSNALATALNNWNSALYSIAGFNVYSSGSGYVDVDAASDQDCPNPQAHGCVLDWYPNTPSGRIFMYSPAFSDQTHRVSDLMHEMGHVLYHANEHYPNDNCSSIMGHCTTYTTVSDHDKNDYRAAYRMKEAPNATYGRLTSSTNFRHYFEGGYLGGDGLTLHAERRYWIDRIDHRRDR